MPISLLFIRNKVVWKATWIILFFLVPAITTAQSIQSSTGAYLQHEIWPNDNPMVVEKKSLALNLKQQCSETLAINFRCNLVKGTTRLFAHLDATRAQEILADYYYFGVPGNTDQKTSLKWHLKAAREKSASAQYKLYALYSDQQLASAGSSTLRGQWLQKSAEGGYSYAWYEYGYHLFNGTLMRKNVSLGLRWLYRASNMGNLYATGLLLEIHKNSKNKINTYNANDDASTEIEYLSISEAQEVMSFFDSHDLAFKTDEYAEAQYDLAMQFHQSKTLYRNMGQAYKWMNTAAQRNNHKAQLNLGIMYFNGIGVKKNEAEAFKWVKKAAKHNYPIAKFFLGTMFADAVGVEKDMNLAAELFKQAAHGGVISAHGELGRLYDAGIGVEHDPDKAIKFKEFFYLNHDKLNEDFKGLVTVH